MKKILAVAVSVFMIAAFMGCSENVKNVSVKDIFANIDEAVESIGMLMETDLTNEEMADANKYMAEAYSLNLDDIEEGIIKAPMINLQVDEVAIIKVKDKSKIEEVKAGMQKRVEQQIESFENYVPANAEIAKNSIIKSKGNYVVLIMSKDAELIDEAFENSFK